MANDILDHNGNSLRDRFAEAALPVLLTQLYWTANHKDLRYDNIYEVAALSAYEAADAMLSARKIKDPPEPNDLVDLDDWSTMSSAPTDGTLIRAYWPRSSSLYVRGGREAHWYVHNDVGMWVPWATTRVSDCKDQPVCWQPLTTGAANDR